LTRLVDLSLTIAHGMAMIPPWPGPVVLPYETHEQAAAQQFGTADDPFTFAATYLALLDHTATHVDAPFHVDPAGATIDACPLEWFAGPAVCLDLGHVPDLGEIDVRDLEEAESSAAVRVDGHIVLLHTGFHARHYPRPSVLTSNPGLTAAATHWLADRGSRVHGVEGPSTDLPGSREMPSHRVCRDRGIVHYEWLVNLDQLIGASEFRFTGYPLKWAGGTGSPVRAVAELP
jgi:kynurenine formamidase